MNEFIFIAVMCMGAKCDFLVSSQLVTEQECLTYKEQFSSLPFKPEVTVATSQCSKIKRPEML
jgi:hypothetical protein